VATRQGAGDVSPAADLNGILDPDYNIGALEKTT